MLSELQALLSLKQRSYRLQRCQSDKPNMVVQFVKWAPFEVDVTDAMMLLRHVTKPLAWLPAESVNLELSAVGQGKVRSIFTLAHTYVFRRSAFHPMTPHIAGCSVWVGKYRL